MYAKGKLEIDNTYIGRPELVIDKEVICYLPQVSNHPMDADPKTSANARRICICCNSHDALVEALGKLVITIELERACKGVFTDVTTVTNAHQALEQAESEE